MDENASRVPPRRSRCPFIEQESLEKMVETEYCEKALNEIDRILELREIIESYELQFSLLIPESLRPVKIHSNPVKIFENRYERWIRILANCHHRLIRTVHTSHIHKAHSLDSR